MTNLRTLVLTAAVASLMTAPSLSLAEAGQCENKPTGEQKAGRGKLAAADTNKDGQLSREEATAAGMPAERFDRVDANKDGQLTKEELKAAKGNRPNKGRKPTE